MADLKFADTHNLVAFLSKPTESKGFEQIVDFLNENPIRYALTINPTIYILCIEQVWSTVKAKTVNGEVQLHALVDGKKIIITESTVRRDLQLEDAEGVDCLPNSTIFEQLTLMRSKITAWNEFSSTMASAIIFFLDKQLEGMPTHNRIYIAPSHTKKIFGNMRRVGKGFSGRETPLFQTMVVQDQAEMGEGSANPTDPHHTPTFIQPSTSQPQKKQKPRKPKRKDTQIPQSSGPTEHVADEAVYKELDDSLVRAATTASSLEAEQDSEVATKDVNLTIDEVTLAQALAALKTVKPKVKANVVRKPSVPVSVASTRVVCIQLNNCLTIPTLRKELSLLSGLDEDWECYSGSKVDAEPVGSRLHAEETRSTEEQEEGKTQPKLIRRRFDYLLKNMDGRSKKDFNVDILDFSTDFPAIVYNDALTSNENVLRTNYMAPLPPRAQRHLWLRYQVDGYTEEIVHDFELGMETGKEKPITHGLTEDMGETLTDRMRMVYTGEEGQVLFSSHAWRRLFEIRGPLVQEFILEFFRTCRISDTELGLDVTDTLCFQLGGPRHPVRRLCHMLISYNISGWGQAPEKADGRKSRAKMSRGHFIGCLAEHFGLVSDEGLMGLTREAADCYGWCPEIAEGAPDVDEDAQVVPAPVQATQPPLAAASIRTMAQRLSRLKEEVHNLRGDMGEQREVLDSMARYFSRFTAWTVTSLSLMMDRSGVRYMSYAHTCIPYQRHRVGEQDKMNGMSHSYQKLKGFFKGVLNLGPEFIRDTKVEEWLTRGHTSMHEMQFGIRRIHAHDTTYLANQTCIDTFDRIPEIGLHGFLIFCTGPRWKEIDNVVIMEYFVKISKKARIMELKRRNLKNTILTSNMSYPSRKIRRICACTSQETTKNKVQYAVSIRPLYAKRDIESMTVVEDVLRLPEIIRRIRKNGLISNNAMKFGTKVSKSVEVFERSTHQQDGSYKEDVKAAAKHRRSNSACDKGMLNVEVRDASAIWLRNLIKNLLAEGTQNQVKDTLLIRVEIEEDVNVRISLCHTLAKAFIVFDVENWGPELFG
ncbi:hypothetical protein Tco_0858946 [Tanacetum coccineum]|uniref:Xylulose kinase-1 n=1 Tax=Tanacetum coccineum TaxID=301880 RepID=A0ABQ5BG91_9ASTR